MASRLSAVAANFYRGGGGRWKGEGAKSSRSACRRSTRRGVTEVRGDCIQDRLPIDKQALKVGGQA
eukprot:5918682-Pleurochrysis_carterae.AAC.1